MLARPSAVLNLILSSLFAASLLATPAMAEMYKWVDENGKTHFGDSVPLKYQQQADKLNKAVAPTDQQKAEAAEAASRTKALAREYDYRNHEKNIEKLKRAEQGKETAEKDEPKPGSCAAKLKAYHESASCFNRYRNANGSLKAEAYEKCKDVPSPEECL